MKNWRRILCLGIFVLVCSSFTDAQSVALAMRQRENNSQQTQETATELEKTIENSIDISELKKIYYDAPLGTAVKTKALEKLTLLIESSLAAADSLQKMKDLYYAAPSKTEIEARAFSFWKSQCLCQLGFVATFEDAKSVYELCPSGSPEKEEAFALCLTFIQIPEQAQSLLLATTHDHYEQVMSIQKDRCQEMLLTASTPEQYRRIYSVAPLDSSQREQAMLGWRQSCIRGLSEIDSNDIQGAIALWNSAPPDSPEKIFLNREIASRCWANAKLTDDFDTLKAIYELTPDESLEKEFVFDLWLASVKTRDQAVEICDYFSEDSPFWPRVQEKLKKFPSPTTQEDPQEEE